MSKAREENEQRVRAEAEQLAQSLVGARVVVAARAGDEGKLFGSIGICRRRRSDPQVHRLRGGSDRHPHPRPIKEIGLHEVTVVPHEDVSVQPEPGRHPRLSRLSPRDRSQGGAGRETKP